MGWMFGFPRPKFICWSPNSQRGCDWRWDSLRSKVKWGFKGPDLIGRVLQAKTPEGARSTLLQGEEAMWGRSRTVAAWEPERAPSSVVSDSATPWTADRQAFLSTPTPGVHSNSCPSSRWCHPAISSSAVPFSPCLLSVPESGSFQTSQFFTSGGQRTGVSASASVLPMNTQGWSPLGWTRWISVLSKDLSGVFSNTTVQKHQFFGAQLSL